MQLTPRLHCRVWWRHFRRWDESSRGQRVKDKSRSRGWVGRLCKGCKETTTAEAGAVGHWVEGETKTAKDTLWQMWALSYAGMWQMWRLQVCNFEHWYQLNSGCLTLLEILEIYWKLAKSPGKFLAHSKFLYFTVYQWKHLAVNQD